MNPYVDLPAMLAANRSVCGTVYLCWPLPTWWFTTTWSARV